MSEPVVLAVDAGGSYIKSAVVEANSRIVGGVSLDAIESKASADQILNTLAAIIKDHLQNFSGVHQIAFAFPGPFDYEQGVCLIQNQDKYDALYGVNLSASLKEILGLPNLEIRYRNDAEAAILGQGWDLPLSQRETLSRKVTVFRLRAGCMPVCLGTSALMMCFPHEVCLRVCENAVSMQLISLL